MGMTAGGQVAGTTNRIPARSNAGYALELNPGELAVQRVAVRIGSPSPTIRGGFDWKLTIDLGTEVNLPPNKSTSLLTIYDDQLPKTMGERYFQFEVEIQGHYGHPQLLLTEPQILQ